MKKLVFLFLFVFLTSCASYTPHMGTHTDLTKVVLDHNKDKTGSACQILGFGDASIVTAAKNANITKVKIVDIKTYQPFAICIKVTGE